MDISVYSQDQITKSADYMKFAKPHALIIVNDLNDTTKPYKSHYCRGTMELEFEDVDNFTNEAVTFDKSMAVDILDFINNLSSDIDAIIVVSKNGQSRSAGIAAALSKLLNYQDDVIYSTHVPNSLVYLTILEEYFLTKHRWSGIEFICKRNAKSLLDPISYKLLEYKQNHK